MDPAHALDWEILDLGYQHVSKKTVHISDMDVHVWGMAELTDLPIGIIVSWQDGSTRLGCADGIFADRRSWVGQQGARHGVHGYRPHR